MFRLKTLRALIQGVSRQAVLDCGGCVCHAQAPTAKQFWIEAKEGHMECILALKGVRVIQGPSIVPYLHNRPGHSII